MIGAGHRAWPGSPDNWALSSDSFRGGDRHAVRQTSPMVERRVRIGRRRISSEARREELLAAARQEFGTRGYYLTQMEHVASAAGVSKALVYQHFTSKEELFAEVSAEVVDTFVSRLPEVLDESGDALTSWRAAVALLTDLVGENPQAWALVARHLADREIGGPLRELRERLTDAVSALLTQYYVPPPGRAAPPDEVARFMTLLVQQLLGALTALFTWWLDHPEVPRDQVATAGVEFAWMGLDRLRLGERMPPAIAGD